MSDIRDLSKAAFEKVLARIKEEGEALTEHPCGFFPGFKVGGMINVGDTRISSEIISLGCTRDHNYLNIPDTMMHCLVWSPRVGALIVCNDTDPRRYVLLRDHGAGKEYWIEGDLEQQLFKLVTYDEIPEQIRKAIEEELAEKGWEQLQNHLLSIVEAEEE